MENSENQVKTKTRLLAKKSELNLLPKKGKLVLS